MIACIEYLIPYLPCKSLCSSSVAANRATEILHILSSVPSPTESTPFFNPSAFNSYDFLPEEMMNCLKRLLQSRVASAA